MAGKWYKTGFDDAKYGVADPPWNPGHRDYESYMDGYRDGEDQARHDEDRKRRIEEAGKAAVADLENNKI